MPWASPPLVKIAIFFCLIVACHLIKISLQDFLAIARQF
jgi:hypothetical protein